MRAVVIGVGLEDLLFIRCHTMEEIRQAKETLLIATLIATLITVGVSCHCTHP